MNIDLQTADAIQAETAFLFPCELREQSREIRVCTSAAMPNGTNLCLYVSATGEGKLMVHEHSVLDGLLAAQCPNLLQAEIDGVLLVFLGRFGVCSTPATRGGNLFWIGANDSKGVAAAIFGMVQFAVAVSSALPFAAERTSVDSSVVQTTGRRKTERWFYLARYMEEDVSAKDCGQMKFGACTRAGWSPRGLRLSEWYSCRAFSLKEAKEKVERGQAMRHT